MKKEMQDRIILMAKRTWQSIGGDILRTCEDMGLQPLMEKEEVIESVMDAGYMGMYGRDKEAYEFFKTLTYKQKTKLMEKAFPFAQYGW
jgi:hypothetical protein